MHQILNDLIEDEADSDLVHELDLFFVLAHGEFLQFFWLLDDLIHSLLLLVLLDVWLILKEAVSDELVNVIIIPQVNSSLVQDVALHIVRSLLWRNSNFGEAKARNEAILSQNFVLVDLISRVERLSKRLELLDVLLSFPWTKAAQKLQLVVPMVMINEEIDVDSDLVHVLSIDLLEVVDQSRLVDVLLQGMKIEVKSLVFAHDWAP